MTQILVENVASDILHLRGLIPNYHILELFNCHLNGLITSIPVVTFYMILHGLYSFTPIVSFFFKTIQLNSNNSAVLCINLIHRTVMYMCNNKQTVKAYTMSCIKPLNWCCLLHLDAIDGLREKSLFNELQFM